MSTVHGEVEWLAGFLEAMPGVVVRCDPAGTVTYVSRGASRVLDMKPSSMIGRLWTSFVHPDDVASAHQWLASVRASHRTVRARLRHRHGAGGWVTLDLLSMGRRATADAVVSEVWSIGMDVTEDAAGEAALTTLVNELAETESRFRLVFEHAPAGMALAAPDGRFLRVNAELCEITGRQAGELLDLRYQDLGAPAELDDDLAQARLLGGDVDRCTFEKRHIRPDGTSVWLEVTASSVRDDRGGVQYVVVDVLDVGDRKAIEQRLLSEALHDALTGLPNRRLLHDRLAHALAADARSGDGVALAFVDLDGFKQVNDQFGHRTGDAVLVEAAHRIASVTRPGDTVGRLGGDEFLVVFNGPLPVERVREAADRIAAAVREPMEVEGVTLVVPASVGTVIVHDVTADDAIARADDAMYAVKHGDRVA